MPFVFFGAHVCKQEQRDLAVIIVVLVVAYLRLQRADKVPPARPSRQDRLLQGSEKKKPAFQAAAFT